ncbi:MAG: iron complex outermembrane receptor protein [Cognaticolwellia sp.]|jgi:iron complex outermembrane receptor protein
MKYSPLFLAISMATPITAYANSSPLEVIEVTGSYFNDYKVDEAKGAMRTDVSLLETAQSVTVISSTIVEEQLATTLGEVLTNDASLSAGSKQRNREVFNLRGFELSSSNGYLRDGHQHWSHYQQPIETLEAVEVIKGPSSILYGQSGPGGLVNMVTKKPTANTLFTIGADTDQEGSTRFTLDAGGALNDDESLRYRGILVKQDVTYQREYQNGDQRERDRFLGALVVDYDVSDDLSLSVHYDYTNDKAGLDTGGWLNEDGNLIGDRKTIRDMSWAFTDIDVENYGADINYNMSDAWRVTLGYNKQTFERQRFESSPKYGSTFNVEGDSYTSNPYDRFDDWQFTTTFIDFVGEFEFAGVSHQLLIGANSLDYSYDQVKANGTAITYSAGQVEPPKPDISYKNPDTTSHSEYDYYGIYVQDLVTFNETWQVSFGGRYDKQNKEGADNESFLPKFGVLYHPSEQATIYYSYTEGFEPQSSETLDNDTDINHGMKLEAMESKQSEIGVKWQLVDDRLLLSGAIFDISKMGKLIKEDLIDSAFESRTTQAGEQRHKGFELGAQGAINDKLFIMSSLINIDAEYERDALYQGNTPVDVPEWSAALWSRYELTEKLAFNAGAFYEGSRFADNQNTIKKDSYTRIDVGATYQMDIKEHELNLRFNINNLLDKRYLIGGGTTSVTAADGISFRLAAQLAF